MLPFNKIQDIALTLLDYLYFYDITSLTTSTEEKFCIYAKLLNTLDNINVERGHDEYRAELYKHFLLCSLELVSNHSSKDQSPESQSPEEQSPEEQSLEEQSPEDQLLEDQRIMEENIISAHMKENIISAHMKVYSLVQKHGFCINEFRADLGFLESNFLDSLNGALSYKLVSQFLYFEYDCISIVFFVKMLGIGILESKKYSAKYAKQSNKDLDKIFLRAMLFIEFELIRRQFYFEEHLKDSSLNAKFDQNSDKSLIYFQVKKMAISFVDTSYTSIANLDLKNIEQVTQYIKDINCRLGHISILPRSMARWVSILGVWFVILNKGQNLNKRVYDPNGEDSCCIDAKEQLLEFGLSINADTLHRQYKKMYNFYKIIRLSVEEVSIDNSWSGSLGYDLIDHFGYSSQCGEQFKVVLNEIYKDLE